MYIDLFNAIRDTGATLESTDNDEIIKVNFNESFLNLASLLCLIDCHIKFDELKVYPLIDNNELFLIHYC